MDEQSPSSTPPSSARKQPRRVRASKQQPAGKRPLSKAFRLYYVCARCNAVTDHFSQHIARCKRPGLNNQQCLSKAKVVAQELLKHTVIKAKDIKRICRIGGRKTIFQSLRHELSTMGHVIVSDTDSDFSSGDDLPSQQRPSRKRTRHQRQRHSPRSCSSSHRTPAKRSRVYIRSDSEHSEGSERGDPELRRLLDSAEEPSINDPTVRNSYKAGSVKESIQRAGLYRRFNVRSRLFIRYSHNRITSKESEVIIGQNIRMVSRMLAFIFEKHGIPLSQLDDDRAVSRLLTYKKINSFFLAMGKCKVMGETVAAFERAVKSLLTYLIYFGRIGRRNIERLKHVHATIKKVSATATRVIREEKGKKAARRYKAHSTGTQPTVRDYQTLFRQAYVQRELQDSMNSITEDYFTESAYQFILRYCVSKLCLHYGKRPQIAKNMTVREYRSRTVQTEQGTSKVCFAVSRHKTKRYRAFEQVVISPEDDDVFNFYLTSCRPFVVPFADDDNGNSSAEDTAPEPFFVSFKHKCGLANPSRIVDRFQEYLGITKKVTTTEVRHRIETESQERFRDNPALQESISEVLGHGRKVALRAYTDPTPMQILPGAAALDILGQDESTLEEPFSPIAHSRTPSPVETPPVEATASPEAEEAQVGTASAPSIDLSGMHPPTVRYLLDEYPVDPFAGIPTEAQLLADRNLGLGKLLPKARDAAKKKYYDFLRNEQRKARIQYMANEIANSVSGMDMTTLCRQERQLLIAEWEDTYKKICASHGWTALPFHSRVLPAIKRAAVSAVGAAIRSTEEAVAGEITAAPSYDNGEEPSTSAVAPEIAAASTAHAASHAGIKKLDILYKDDELLQLYHTQEWPGVVVKSNLGERGRGVFVMEDTKIPKTQLVCDYKGKIMTEARHTEKLEQVKEQDIDKYNRIITYRLFLQNRADQQSYIVDAHKENNSFGRLINHSKDHPNVYPVLKLLTDSEGIQHKRIFFYALRKIKPGEELLWNYGPDWRDAAWYNTCPCRKCNLT